MTAYTVSFTLIHPITKAHVIDVLTTREAENKEQAAILAQNDLLKKGIWGKRICTVVTAPWPACTE